MAMVAAGVMASCELDVDVNSKDVVLSDITIECIDETTISNNTSGNMPFTKHTYLCRGSISGYSGACYIRVLHNSFIVHNNHELTIAGNSMPFEFTFAPEWEYLDNPYNTFTVELYDNSSNLLCKTTIVATKHPENAATQPTNVPFIEYSLWGTQCEWQLPKLDNNVIVINSDEELSRYIISASEANYPTVDFAKHTMIIAHGYCLNGIAESRISSLQRVADTELRLNIEIYRDLTDVVEPWNFALLVDKWDRLYNIDLNVDMQDAVH